MFKLAICDDSARDAEYLRRLCNGFKENAELSVSAFSNGADLLSEHARVIFDIVLLDVDMPGDNGLEIGKALRAISAQTVIIFVTSYPQYAIEAYDCEAFHYLLKPCDEQKLYQVINRAISKLKVTKKYHLIKTQKMTVKLKISEIYYVECCRKHIIYHTQNDSFDTIGTLSETYDLLKEYGFFQVHQGYLVNFEKIKCFSKNDIILDNDRAVMMSVRKKKETLIAYSRYLEKSI